MQNIYDIMRRGHMAMAKENQFVGGVEPDKGEAH